MAKVTIDVPDSIVSKISHFASVSRTMDNARAIANELESRGANTDYIDRIRILEGDLDEIQIPLDTVFTMVRSEIWRITREASMEARG